MKNTRKLIPALAMLLISAVLMSTASFAWFSMNEQVTATGMEITAQSDNVWLAINEGDTFDKTQAVTEFTSQITGKKLYPVALKVPALTSVPSGGMYQASLWYYAYSDDAASSTATTGQKDIAQDDLDDYVAYETFSIGLSDISSVTSVDNLRLKSVTLPANTGISIVIVCGDYVYNITESNANYNKTIADAVTKTGVTVTVYYYINGEDTNVTTNNIANLTGSVDLIFTVES